MDQFNTYVNENLAEAKGLPKDWVFNDFTVFNLACKLA
jgi:hypothetical protein